jgi:hypothetical protein
MLDRKRLVLMSETERARFDIAAVNLACASGLPGGPTEAEITECLNRLDEYVRVAGKYTEHCYPRFVQSPSDYRNSEGYFRILCLVTILWKRFDVHYNLAKVPLDVPLERAGHGQRRHLCLAPRGLRRRGRRLGYPIKLVTTQGGKLGHCFARWDDPKGERFNIDVCPDGLFSHPDDYYRQARMKHTDEEAKALGLLKSMTPKEELAHFSSTDPVSGNVMVGFDNPLTPSPGRVS